jgi:transcriptional regulator of acetoin/glycerol metabolism
MSPDRQWERNAERQWLRLARDGGAGAEVKPVVRDSWDRCREAHVPLELMRAPLVLDADALAAARERNDWIGYAQEVARSLPQALGDEGHVLALFDADARMLASEGDPAIRERLAEINFTPGGLWDEAAAGTNGPGTALATGRPVHVVGPEHYCEGWHRWHCAAAPIRDPASGGIEGVLDITGPSERADSHLLNLVRALTLAVEHAMAARQLERRCKITRAFTDIAARYPNEVVLAVDHTGEVILASPAAPPEFNPARGTPGPIRTALAALVADAPDGGFREAAGLLGRDQATAVVYPVVDGAIRIGASVLIRRVTTTLRSDRPQRSTRYSFLDLMGQSSALAEASRIAGVAAANALPVLILGESGVGKELFAQSIHSASERRERPFIAVNCGALPAELIESELFGYTGGAYSGARREGSAGKFEAANGGTLFLDEIGELPPAAQTALLRALQEGEITRVGEAHSRSVNVRIIAATNRDIGTALEHGEMRADLYYRLAVLTIELPPLRERRDDIPLLAQHFLASACASLHRQSMTLDPDALRALLAYDWPGNVRELQNVMSSMAALASGSRLGWTDLPAHVRGGHRGRVPEPSSPARSGATPTPSRDFSPNPAAGDALQDERAKLLAVIEAAATMSEAAACLGITRSTLYRRLQRCGLQPKRVFG